jgi:hypothetical protein
MMNRITLPLCFIAALMLSAIASSQSFLSHYGGVPYHDNMYHDGPQKIPGRVLCAYYDLGGEGIAYHDSDPQNRGSGELNPAVEAISMNFVFMRESIFLHGPSLASGSTLQSMCRTQELIWLVFSTPPIVAEQSQST